jgi:hypothetical protein
MALSASNELLKDEFCGDGMDELADSSTVKLANGAGTSAQTSEDIDDKPTTTARGIIDRALIDSSSVGGLSLAGIG